MKIMIAGGRDDMAREGGAAEQLRLEAFAIALAEQVIEQGHDLRCGNISSLDAIIIETAAERCREQGQDETVSVISHVPDGVPPRVNRGLTLGSTNSDWASVGGRRVSVPEPIEEADVLILVGGKGDASGTYTAKYWAMQCSTPVLPIATFGMAANEIYRDLLREKDPHKQTGLTKPDLQKLARSAASLDTDQSVADYAAEVIRLAEKAALSREVFLVMSFASSESLKDYERTVRRVCKEAGFDAVRTDTRPAEETHQIIDEIHEKIESCAFVIADLTDARPNVYYEIGYAMGVHSVSGRNRKLILTAKDDTEVGFDLTGYNRLVWMGTASLEDQLAPIVARYAKDFGIRRPDGDG